MTSEFVKQFKQDARMWQRDDTLEKRSGIGGIA